jgi:hypothetical protein
MPYWIKSLIKKGKVNLRGFFKKSCGQVITLLDESRKGGQGSSGGKHVSLLLQYLC